MGKAMHLIRRRSVSEGLLLTAGLIGVVHHIDHVLRFGHSGWPFKTEVSTFTFSLLVYPVIALTLAARRGSLTRVALATVAFLAPTLAHVLIEPPAHQHDTWVNHPDVNLLGVSSPRLGDAANVITVLLSTVALAAVIAFAREWWAERA